MRDPLARGAIEGTDRHLNDGDSTPRCPGQYFHLKLVSPGLGPEVHGSGRGKSGIRIVNRKAISRMRPRPKSWRISGPSGCSGTFPLLHPHTLPYHNGTLPLAGTL